MTRNRTRWQLAGGIIAAPLFFTVAFAQAFAREGFDIKQHMISQLATGDLAWIQIANFVTVGILYILCAAGMRQLLSPAHGGTWGPRLIATFGAGLVAAGVFVTDPAGGYPPATVSGGPSWHGIAHGVAAMVAGLALVAAIAVFAWRFATLKEKGWAIFSAVIGMVYFALPFTNSDLGGLPLAVASLVGWGWISILATRLTFQHGAIQQPNRHPSTPAPMVSSHG
ncbi:MAG TPA: DUF998 domain-containing protein [Micromonosporaceae bacterium]|nr:DUF998 domain-containing protein [Micromonosporaceae bacterium]HCU50630.1 DUF998 domain-containing protein [Micromonosporaceae bacterium]